MDDGGKKLVSGKTGTSAHDNFRLCGREGKEVRSTGVLEYIDGAGILRAYPEENNPCKRKGEITHALTYEVVLLHAAAEIERYGILVVRTDEIREIVVKISNRLLSRGAKCQEMEGLTLNTEQWGLGPVKIKCGGQLPKRSGAGTPEPSGATSGSS